MISSCYFVLQANFITPGKRPLSSCVPTVVLHEEVTVLLIKYSWASYTALFLGKA